MLLNTSASTTEPAQEQAVNNRDRSCIVDPVLNGHLTVIPMPGVENWDRGEASWQPPKEVLWIGRGPMLLALRAECSSKVEQIPTQAEIVCAE